jgi:hypothetical protein
MREAHHERTIRRSVRGERSSPMRFPRFYVTTPSGFACHPSDGGEFSVPSLSIVVMSAMID